MNTLLETMKKVELYLKEMKCEYYLEDDKFLSEADIDGRKLKDILIKGDLKIITIF